MLGGAPEWSHRHGFDIYRVPESIELFLEICRVGGRLAGGKLDASLSITLSVLEKACGIEDVHFARFMGSTPALLYICNRVLWSGVLCISFHF